MVANTRKRRKVASKNDDNKENAVVTRKGRTGKQPSNEKDATFAGLPFDILLEVRRHPSIVDAYLSDYYTPDSSVLPSSGRSAFDTRQQNSAEHIHEQVIRFRLEGSPIQSGRISTTI